MGCIEFSPANSLMILKSSFVWLLLVSMRVARVSFFGFFEGVVGSEGELEGDVVCGVSARAPSSLQSFAFSF